MGGADSLRRSIDAVRAVQPSMGLLLGGPRAEESVDLVDRCEVCVTARRTLEAADRLLEHR
jgi:hypothetical protein